MHRMQHQDSFRALTTIGGHFSLQIQWHQESNIFFLLLWLFIVYMNDELHYPNCTSSHRPMNTHWISSKFYIVTPDCLAWCMPRLQQWHCHWAKSIVLRALIKTEVYWSKMLLAPSSESQILWALLDSRAKKAAIHQLTTMLSTSKNVLFLSHNHLLTNGADDPSLIITLAGPRDNQNVGWSAPVVMTWK